MIPKITGIIAKIPKINPLFNQVFILLNKIPIYIKTFRKPVLIAYNDVIRPDLKGFLIRSESGVRAETFRAGGLRIFCEAKNRRSKFWVFNHPENNTKYPVIISHIVPTKNPIATTFLIKKVIIIKTAESIIFAIKAVYASSPK